MLKKYTALLFMMVAYAMLMGHNMIPHHHHHDLHDLAQHHQTDHNHDSEEAESLGHVFTHFVHSADGFALLTKQCSNKIFIPVAATLPDNFSVDEIIIPPISYQPPAEHFDHLFSYACTFGLRAPPAFVA